MHFEVKHFISTLGFNSHFQLLPLLRIPVQSQRWVIFLQYSFVFVLYPCKLPNFCCFLFHVIFSKGYKAWDKFPSPWVGRTCCKYCVHRIVYDIGAWGQGPPTQLGSRSQRDAVVSSCHTVSFFFFTHLIILWCSLPNPRGDILFGLFFIFFTF